MFVVRYETQVEEYMKLPRPFIFLAGPTVRGNQPHLQPSWRFAAIAMFKENEFKGTLIAPEFTDLTASDKNRYDLPLWEYEGLKCADRILFWIPRTRELIGLTTNFELGYWLRDRKRVIYGRPDNAYRIDYLDILWRRDYDEHNEGDSRICRSLEETINVTIQSLKDFS